MMKAKARTLHIRRLVLSAAFLACALVLPFLTGQIQQIGSMLCPMHFPIILCGFFCGPWYGLAVGFIAPILRFFLFGMPMLYPNAAAMSFELAAYGFFTALLYRALPDKKGFIYVALILSMLIGRLVWGLARVVMLGLAETPFSFELFITAGFVEAIPGMIVQIAVIPVLIMVLKKFTYTDSE